MYWDFKHMQEATLDAGGGFHPHPNLPPSRGKGLLHILQHLAD